MRANGNSKDKLRDKSTCSCQNPTIDFDVDCVFWLRLNYHVQSVIKYELCSTVKLNNINLFNFRHSFTKSKKNTYATKTRTDSIYEIFKLTSKTIFLRYKKKAFC